MSRRHRGFWPDMLSKVGTPVFAATLVACLLKEEVQLIHIILMSTGLALMYLGHRLDYHDD